MQVLSVANAMKDHHLIYSRSLHDNLDIYCPRNPPITCQFHPLCLPSLSTPSCWRDSAICPREEDPLMYLHAATTPLHQCTPRGLGLCVACLFICTWRSQRPCQKLTVFFHHQTLIVAMSHLIMNYTMMGSQFTGWNNVGANIVAAPTLDNNYC